MAIRVAEDRCVGCGGCVALCPAGALWLDETRVQVDDACTECGLCESLCPVGALTLGDAWPTLYRRPLRRHYDVLVVGAGPAGSMAATRIAAAPSARTAREQAQTSARPKPPPVPKPRSRSSRSRQSGGKLDANRTIWAAEGSLAVNRR
jgi:ferredoxin